MAGTRKQAEGDNRQHMNYSLIPPAYPYYPASPYPYPAYPTYEGYGRWRPTLASASPPLVLLTARRGSCDTMRSGCTALTGNGHA